MFNKPINFKKLHQGLSATYKRQMEIKREFPHRFEWPEYDSLSVPAYRAEMEARKPWRDARVEFDNLSVTMTLLCCILNHAKGKLHMKKLTKRAEIYGCKEREEMTLKNQADFIGNAWQGYIAEDEEEAVKIAV